MNAKFADFARKTQSFKCFLRALGVISTFSAFNSPALTEYWLLGTDILDTFLRWSELSERAAPALLLCSSRFPCVVQFCIVQDCTTKLTDMQLRVLRALALCGGEHAFSCEFMRAAGMTNTASVKRALTSLCASNLIYRHGGEYKFVSPFFREWVRRHRRRSWAA